MPDSHRDNVVLAQAAVVVALSLSLANVKLLELPAGGSISFGSLPLLAFAVVHGVRRSVLPCAAAGVSHAIAGGTIVHPAQLGLDYLLGYLSLALAGLTSGSNRIAVAMSVALATTCQFACFVLSGAIFFANGAALGPALTFSLGYNAITIVPELLLALWLTPTLVLAVRRAEPTDIVPHTPRPAPAPAPVPVLSVTRPTDTRQPETVRVRTTGAPALRLDTREPLRLPSWQSAAR